MIGNSNSLKLDSGQIKRVLLDILIFIDEICKKYGIKYFLAYGTLLGAVRHNGFIPRDDDIDIYMLRDDYEKFLKIMEINDNLFYKLYTPRNKADYYNPYAKVVDVRTDVRETKLKSIEGYGLWVDIFPLDFLEKNIFKKSKMFVLENKRFAASCEEFVPGKSFFKTLIKRGFYILGKRKSPSKIAMKMDILAKNNSNSGELLTMPFATNAKKEIYQKTWFDESVILSFEGYAFSAPKNYLEILNMLYGNFMELPKEEDRVYHCMDVTFRQ